MGAVPPVSTVDVRSFRRRYLGFGRVLIVAVVLLQIPAWMYIYHRAQPFPVYQQGTNKQFALAQANEAFAIEPLGRPIPVSHTAFLVRRGLTPSLAHVYVDGSNLQFVFPKGPDVCVSVPPVPDSTSAVPKVVTC
jgi:hypothetical protein